jgi:biopolymer transport protein ExbD
LIDLQLAKNSEAVRLDSTTTDREMIMSFSSASSTMSEINTTPLIDVMLVLLIIFMLTAPVTAHRVQAQLPQGTVLPTDHPPTVLKLRVLPNGSLTMDEQPVSQAALLARLAGIGKQPKAEQEVVQLGADQAAPYERVTQVLTEMHRANVLKISFSGLGADDP